MQDVKIKVALVDDHILMRNSLAGLVNACGNYEVILEANNGRDFFAKLQPKRMPDLVLMDITMPEMDGYETTLGLQKKYPLVKVLALSMNDTEPSIIRMLRNGARGYILKDVEPAEFRKALDSVIEKGYYYSEMVSGRLINAVSQGGDSSAQLSGMYNPSAREIEFFRLICSELTYKEIAEKMSLSPRTIDGYRDALFEKLKIHTRVGLVLYAIKNGIVTV